MTDLTKSIRNVKELNPLCESLLSLAIEKIKKDGINPLIIETYRSQQRQNYLYCKGRTFSECTAKGIEESFAKKYCSLSESKVTWTLNSIHTKRNAVDLIPVRNGIAIWNSKNDDTQRIIKIMQKYGFEAGANWITSPDSPHFQIKGVSELWITYSRSNNNKYITKVIQRALNKKLGIHLVVDGIWGSLTTAAVMDYRKKKGWIPVGWLGPNALKRLLS
jgi:peptidoglycan L-alanyl-D-glutamate endopeptidase CwlK